jgi:uncharacterized Zn-binding protein involved in type VI secretion
VLVELCAVVCLCAGNAAAQAVVEYAGAVSSAGISSAAAAKLASSRLPIHGATAGVVETGAENTTSAHLPMRAAGDPVGDNRRALEAKAGKDGAKLMLRSAPNGATVWINGKEVGATPLLLVVPPGAYKVEMQSFQRESSRKQVDLLPKETREVLLTLASRYPTHVALAWHHQ